MNGPMWMSALDPGGPLAAHVARLFWWFFAVTGTVFVIVMLALAWAVVRGRRRRDGEDAGAPMVERQMMRIVGGSIALTVVILFGLLVLSIATGRQLSAYGSMNATTISIVGHQWWWEINYEDPVPMRKMTTANEIHVPVGRPIVLNVTSRDVIHSFWIPSLSGKRDLIPGYTTSIPFRVDRPGTYRGQCAEFCGRQHAKMAITVVAEAPDAFARWLDDQRLTAREPASDEERRGRDVFMTAPCASCHRIIGTSANGNIGPVLTHVGSRAHIASATLPNLQDPLSHWIRNSQDFKPGNEMPPHALSAEDIQALVRYLESLK
jgi:cytochrome c oxidase subunit 2